MHRIYAFAIKNGKTVVGFIQLMYGTDWTGYEREDWLTSDLYKEYEDSCNEIIKKSEFIKETIKYNSQLEDENLTEKWIKINP